MNISSFIEWFVNQVMRIFTYIWNTIDNIIIYGNVTLLDFLITLTIIIIFLEIILTIPQNSMNKAEKNVREYKAEQRRQQWKGRTK